MLLTAAAAVLAVACVLPAAADEPYRSYTFSRYDQRVLPAPQAYVTERVLYGADLGCGPLAAPEDLYIAPNGHLYIADTGNRRIIELSADHRFLREWKGYEDKGTLQAFQSPTGVFADEAGTLYVADPARQAVLHMDAAGKLLRAYEKGDSEILGDDFVYKPVRAVADSVGRVYIVSEGTFEGILQYNRDGAFIGFLGANRVSASLTELFWNNILTQEQREGRKTFVPIDFNNIAIDGKDFLYCTFGTVQDNLLVKKLNPSGVNVLRRQDSLPVTGDLGELNNGDNPGPSVFIDACVTGKGLLACLDSKRGRVFTYDGEGNLLYTFGGLGDQDGLFRQPTSIAAAGDRFLVLDKLGCSLTVFRPTAYAQTMHTALTAYSAGDYDASAAAWQQVLDANMNGELAYIGVGKAYLRQGDYAAAKTYFRYGSSKEQYSKAQKLERREWASHNFGWIIVFVVVGVALLFLFVSKGWRRSMAARWHKRRAGKRGGTAP